MEGMSRGLVIIGILLLQLQGVHAGRSIPCATDSTGLYAAGPATAKRSLRVKRSREDHGTHYFLATSAIPLNEREGYYKNTLVSLNSGAYGITRHLSVSGGVDLLSVISSKADRILWYSRMQVSGSLGGMVHAGAQVLHASLPLPQAVERPPGTGLRRGFTAGLGMLTVGDAELQLTLCGGVVHDGERFADTPLLGAAAMVRVAANLAVVTEHWWLSGSAVNYPVHSLGVRILGDHLALDVGLAYDRELAARVLPFGLPFVSGILNF